VHPLLLSSHQHSSTAQLHSSHSVSTATRQPPTPVVSPSRSLADSLPSSSAMVRVPRLPHLSRPGEADRAHLHTGTDQLRRGHRVQRRPAATRHHPAQGVVWLALAEPSPSTGQPDPLRARPRRPRHRQGRHCVARRPREGARRAQGARAGCARQAAVRARVQHRQGRLHARGDRGEQRGAAGRAGRLGHRRRLRLVQGQVRSVSLAFLRSLLSYRTRR